MAVSDHLKIASAELRKAADLVKVEIENLRNEETNTIRSINNHVADLMRQIQGYEHDLRVSNGDESPQIQTILQRVRVEIAQRRAEVRDKQAQIENMIRDRQNLVNDLESKARMIMP